MDFTKNYYAILEVSDIASEAEIKQAYRRLARQYHPDLHPGNQGFEEKTKEINEAKEILLDAGTRFVYDEYRKSAAQQKSNYSKETQRRTATTTPRTSKKIYTRTRTIETITRHYFKGIIFIKYYAPFDTAKEDTHLREFYYQIHFTEVHLEIDKVDMIIDETPPAIYNDIFNKYSKTDIPILQPVKTILTTEDGSKKGILFHTEDLRIIDPQITLVTKHETTSFGTIESPVYGFIKESHFHDITEEVEESSGPTGKQETKIEDNILYKREEYYHYNGNTYWSNWKWETPDYQQWGTNYNQHRQNYSKRRRNSFNAYVSSGGCASSTLNGIIGILYIGFILFQIPAIWPMLLFLLIIFLIGKMIRFISGPGIRHTNWILAAFIILFFIALIGRFSGSLRTGSTTHTSTASTKANEKTVRTPVHNYDPSRADTLISHFRSWSDYDNNLYEGTYSVSAKQVAAAAMFKTNIAYAVNNNNSYDHMVWDLKNRDSSSLSDLYTLFDTTGSNRKLSQDKFAEMIVSFVQDIPYSLVLDKDCDPLHYSIPSVREYLSKQDASCDPYQRFGINSPVEFLASLKGDCDTRALLLYQALSHYHYDVVMLTSDVYNHSLIGINLPYTGAAYKYGGASYALWETTSPGFRPGFIPAEISDLNYWRISLKSK